MSAFTSAAQGDNCCGQRKNSFNLPKTFHDLCSLGCGLVEVESTRIRKGLQEAPWYCPPASTRIPHYWRPHFACDHTSNKHMCGWQSYHTQVDYEKQYQSHRQTYRAHPKPGTLEQHHDGTGSVPGRREAAEASPKIYARARLHESECVRQRQTYSM
jgi:hypothetical protein